MKIKKLLLGLAVLFLGSAASADEFDLHMVLLKGNKVSNSFVDEVADLGGTITYSHDIGLAFVTGLDDDTADALAAHKDVSEMELDEVFELELDYDADSAESVEAIPDSAGDPAAAFFFARQWNMRAIGADAAWNAGRTGSEDITVAILDTGIDYLYPDLVGRVDLSRSVSFEAIDDFYTSIFFPGRHPVTDLYFHGTHVASTVVSNADVIAGVTSQTTLIGVKVCNVFGSCPFSSVIAGVLHAADNGAHVANMSLGGGFTKAGNGRFVGFINSVFNYANKEGMTIVVSAGNSAIDMDHDGNSYKSYCSAPNTVCVSATGPTSGGTFGPWTDVDALAPYSNYGRSAISVAAPGGTGPGGGWVWAACSQTSLVIPICQTGTFILGSNGTSMAAPHVSGVAALLAEEHGYKPGQIRTKLQQTADDLGQPGTDPDYGKGRVSAANAVSQ